MGFNFPRFATSPLFLFNHMLVHHPPISKPYASPWPRARIRLSELSKIIDELVAERKQLQDELAYMERIDQRRLNLLRGIKKRIKNLHPHQGYVVIEFDDALDVVIDRKFLVEVLAEVLGRNSSANREAAFPFAFAEAA